MEKLYLIPGFFAVLVRKQFVAKFKTMGENYEAGGKTITKVLFV